MSAQHKIIRKLKRIYCLMLFNMPRRTYGICEMLIPRKRIQLVFEHLRIRVVKNSVPALVICSSVIDNKKMK